MQDDLKAQRTGLAMLGIALAAGLVIAALIVAGTFERIKRAGDTITVKGYAEEQVVSDVGLWRGNLTARASVLQDAYARLDADSARVVEFLRERIAGEGELKPGPVSMSTRYEYTAQGVMTGQVAGYQLEQSFEVTSSDVELIAHVAREASALISEGIELNSWPPQYFYSDLNEVKVRLLGAATRDARLRAAQFADNSGVAVGPLKSAAQGVFQITRVNSTETADYGSYDTSTIEKSVKAVVTIEYAVERD
ncbi:MAG TPA: SIMPL domain-containing protein [Steroidobacteraceae bacterium]|nr:SIMPL domain-containing protein [Steroidobacteraceae bacterium]